MRAGVRAGPFWVGTGGGRRHGPIGKFGVVFIAWLAIGWASPAAAVWVAWIGVPLWAVCAIVRAAVRSHRKRAAAKVPA